MGEGGTCFCSSEDLQLPKFRDMALLYPILKSRIQISSDGSLYSEPRSYDKNDIRAGSPLSKLSRYTNGGTFGSDGFKVHQTSLQGGSSMDRDWNLRLSGHETDSLARGHRGHSNLLLHLEQIFGKIELI